MLKDITVGQYYPTSSPIHKLDAGLKLIATILFMISIFMINKMPVYIGVFAVLLILTVMSKIPVKFILKGLKPLKWIILFTFIVNMFCIPGEKYGHLDF